MIKNTLLLILAAARLGAHKDTADHFSEAHVPSYRRLAKAPLSPGSPSPLRKLMPKPIKPWNTPAHGRPGVPPPPPARHATVNMNVANHAVDQQVAGRAAEQQHAAALERRKVAGQAAEMQHADDLMRQHADQHYNTKERELVNWDTFEQDMQHNGLNTVTHTRPAPNNPNKKMHRGRGDHEMIISRPVKPNYGKNPGPPGKNDPEHLIGLTSLRHPKPATTEFHTRNPSQAPQNNLLARNNHTGPAMEIFNDGNVHKGFYKNGKKQGLWMEPYGDNVTMEGRYVDGVRDGNWKMTLADGAVHQGPVKNGTMNGDWTINWIDGAEHKGRIVDNLKQGEWTTTYKDQSVFKGPMRDGERDGKWTMNYAVGKDGTRVTDTGHYHKDRGILINDEWTRTRTKATGEKTVTPGVFKAKDPEFIRKHVEKYGTEKLSQDALEDLYAAELSQAALDDLYAAEMRQVRTRQEKRRGGALQENDQRTRGNGNHNGDFARGGALQEAPVRTRGNGNHNGDFARGGALQENKQPFVRGTKGF